MRKFFKPISLLLLLAALLLSPVAPARGQANEPALPEVVDFSGRAVRLETPARRVVCLIESALSGIYMLGAQERVVAVSTNIYQESVRRYYAAMDPRIAAKTLPAPGNWDFVSLESVVALGPDLVIVWASQRETIDALAQKKIAVYAVELKTFDDVYKEIEDFGMLLDRRERSRELIAYTRAELEKIRAPLAAIPLAQRPGVYFMWAQAELETSGAPSTVNDVIELAGGRNVCGHIRQEHAVVNLENLVVWRPEVIVLWANPRSSPQQLMERPVWRALPAARNRRVHELPSVFFCDLWTLKFLHAVKLVGHWCHPQASGAMDPDREKRVLLEALYGPELGRKIPLEEE
jgi:iron complex transport system substrate-binding protein